MSTTATRPGLVRTTERISALDVLRGVALCGIIFVNIGPLVEFGTAAGYYPAPSLDDPTGWLQLFVQQRFFPVFSLLFGIGFSLFLESARRRTERPRVVLLRRLLILLAIGIPFNFLQPGAALLPYAIVGLVVLLPSTWLPRWVVAGAAVVAAVASIVLDGGGISLIPGMFLLGSTLTRFGVVQSIGRSRRGAAIWSVVSLVIAVPLLVWHAATIETSNFSPQSAAAGLALASCYAGAVAFLMTTRFAGVLQRVFAPLGRTALTNYVLAAPLMLAGSLVLDLPHSTNWWALLGLAGSILVAQWVASTVWLRYCAQGPLEWLWRWGTWGRRAPLRLNANPT